MRRRSPALLAVFVLCVAALLGAGGPAGAQVGPPVDGEPTGEQARAAAELLRSLVGVLVAIVGLVSLLGTVLERFGTAASRQFGHHTPSYTYDVRAFSARVAGYGGLAAVGAAIAAGGRVMWATLALGALAALVGLALWYRGG